MKRKPQPRIRAGVRKGDTVKIISGRNRGKTGRVLSVDPAHRRITVEHANIIKRHTRANPQKNIKGGIVEREAPMDISNVMLVVQGSNQTVRIGYKFLPDGTKVRVGRHAGDSIDL